MYVETAAHTKIHTRPPQLRITQKRNKLNILLNWKHQGDEKFVSMIPFKSQSFQQYFIAI